MKKVYKVEGDSVTCDGVLMSLKIEEKRLSSISARSKIAYVIIQDCLCKWEALKHYQELCWYSIREGVTLTEERVRHLCLEWDVESFKKVV